jgi:hypothetical protein
MMRHLISRAGQNPLRCPAAALVVGVGIVAGVERSQGAAQNSDQEAISQTVYAYQLSEQTACTPPAQYQGRVRALPAALQAIQAHVQSEEAKYYFSPGSGP